MSDDNVVPINGGKKDVQNIQDYRRIEGTYTGPADAVQAILKSNGFDDHVKGKGWIELTVIGRFDDEGCVFHTVQARAVALQVKAPGLTLLRLLAADHEKDRDFYAKLANEGELNILDQELADATPEQLTALACGEQEEVDGVIAILRCQRAARVLNNIFKRGS